MQILHCGCHGSTTKHAQHLAFISCITNHTLQNLALISCITNNTLQNLAPISRITNHTLQNLPQILYITQNAKKKWSVFFWVFRRFSACLSKAEVSACDSVIHIFDVFELRLKIGGCIIRAGYKYLKKVYKEDTNGQHWQTALLC